MSSETTVGIVVGVAVGLVAAHIGNKALLDLNQKLHEEELAEARTDAYQEGWREASTNAENIRRRFKEMFGSEDKEKGTAFKS